MYDKNEYEYNEYLETYFDQYMALSNNKKSKLGNKYDPVNLFLVDVYDYNNWLKREEFTDKKEESTDNNRVICWLKKEDTVDLSDIPPLEGGEEIKEGKGLNILPPNKLLTRLQILLAQIKAGNNSCKLKSEIRQMLFTQHKKITKKVYNSLIKSL